MRLFDKTGVIHVHTRYSDGAGTVRRVAQAAVRAGLDFVIVTDHDTLAGLENGDEGWYDRRGRIVQGARPAGRPGRTLVIIGYEISPDDGNHFLALGLDEVVPKEEGPPAYVREVARRGGLGFVAHPVYPPPRRYPLKTFPWTARDVRGFAGVEIWTYSVDWLTDVTTLPRLAAAVAAPDRFVDGPFPEALAWWDALCREAWARGRRVPGIGGADAHGILYSYRRMFRAVRTHVLLDRDWTGDAAADKRAVLEALREGRAYVAYDGLQDATGFRFFAEAGDVEVPMGGVVRLHDGSRPGSRERLRAGAEHRPAGRGHGPPGRVVLRARAPVPCVLTLRTPAGTVARAESGRLDCAVREPGVYRVEAHLPGRRGTRPWVFANPIYVR